MNEQFINKFRNEVFIRSSSIECQRIEYLKKFQQVEVDVLKELRK